MSGISTMTRQYVDAIAGTGARVLDTRKTIPGLRVLDKYAVRCGGGENHRLDLSDGILIKNNHISLGGGIENVLQRAHESAQAGADRSTVEVRTFENWKQRLENGAESLLLDNMTPAEVKKAVGSCAAADLRSRLKPRAAFVLDNIRKYALAGVDYISVGALTHSALR